MIQIRTNVDMELPNVINVTCFYFREKHFYMTISLNSVLIRLDQFLQISSACTRPVPARNFFFFTLFNPKLEFTSLKNLFS